MTFTNAIIPKAKRFVVDFVKDRQRAILGFYTPANVAIIGFLLSLLALKMADFNESIVFESPVNFARSKLYRLVLAMDTIFNVKYALINNLPINFAKPHF